MKSHAEMLELIRGAREFADAEKIEAATALKPAGNDTQPAARTVVPRSEIKTAV